MFIAYVMFPGNDINAIQTFDNESEADTFGNSETTYPDRVVDGIGEYDPPIVLLFEAPSLSIADRNKYTHTSGSDLPAWYSIQLYPRRNQLALYAVEPICTSETERCFFNFIRPPNYEDIEFDTK